MSGSQPRKRDLIRNLLSRPAKSSSTAQQVVPPAPSATAPSSTASPSSIPTLQRSDRNFLDEALLELTATEQAIIRQHDAHGSRDIGAAVDAAYNSALEHRRICDSEKWHWNFRGRTIFLRDEADKVLAWLDRFKFVGDIMASGAPVHAGLPWAGIRVLLEAVVSESRQRALLLVGLNLTLGLATRLKVYFDFLMRLPATIAKTNFENALLKIYTHILRFIAAAILAYKRSSRSRTWYAFWQISTMEDFEAESGKLGLEAEIEASNCDRVLQVQNLEHAKKWRDELRNALRNLDDIGRLQTSLDILQIKVDLTKLITAKGATYNSYAEGDLARCLEGTRTQLLDQIASWASDPYGKCIFWLCGMAGTGKSTISRTVAHTLDGQRRLGASFFFKRGEGDRGNASRFFPTIATQLADMIPGLSTLIAKALDTDSLLCERNLQEQFEKLLLGPLLNAPPSVPLSPGFIVVIDALDECERSMDIRMILRLLARVETLASLRLRIFVTSRPELPIQLEFRNTKGELHQDIVLEEVQASTIEHDIRAYFKFMFEEIKSEWSLQTDNTLPVDWPGDDNIHILVDLAVPLFIFAFTVCRFISQSNPRKRLDTVLEQRKIKSFSRLDKTYVPILNQLILDRDEQEHADVIKDFRDLVGPIVLLADPLSASSLSTLLDIPPEDVRERLRRLHSVLNISTDRAAPIRLLHLSFRDFLVDTRGKDTNRFWIDESQTHAMLAQLCLRRLNRPETLKRDLVGVKKPGFRRSEISKQQVAQSIDADVAYACCYWAWHLMESKEKICDGGPVHEFLKSQFLHWLEALSWLSRLTSAVAYITDLESLVQVDQSDQLLAFLDDAKCFLLRNRHVIDLAPLQLYHSALIFTPMRSIIRNTFEDRRSQVLGFLPKVPMNWSSEIQTLEGHQGAIRAVAFSPDGYVLASASEDETVRLWNTRTGEEIQKLEGHEDGVTAVAFSPVDGYVLASASEDETVRLWNTRTGEEIQKIEGHDNRVTAVAFSPVDGYVLASALGDKTVRLWDARSGAEIQRFEGHEDGVTAVAFSPDGCVVASGSYDETVRLWNARTGEEIQKLEGHEDGVTVAAFSPDGQVVVSGSYDKTVRLWNAQTGKEMQKLEGHFGHDDYIITVAFSPDGLVVVSGSGDKTVRLWNTRTRETHKLHGHKRDVKAVAFSLDGLILASGSFDRTIRLWNIKGEETPRLEGHDFAVTTVAISPDGQMVASGSLDKTVRLWNTIGQEMQKCEGHDDYIIAVAISPDGQMVASGSLDKTVRLWNTMGQEMHKCEGHRAGVVTVAFSPDGQVVASGSWDKTVRLWNTMGQETHKLEGHDDTILTVAFSRDGQVIASGSADNTVRLWHTKGKETHKLEGHQATVSAVAFSLDGLTIASSSWDKTVRLWNTTGEEIQTLKGHQEGVTAVAFSPGRPMVASASYDHTVRLWNVSTGEQMRLIQTDGAVVQLAFTRDGKSLEINRETFELNSGSPSSAHEESIRSANLERGHHLRVRGQWIRRNGEDIIWLPHEYRGDKWASYDSLLVIGQNSGPVSFFGI